MAGVSTPGVQWMSLALGKPPSCSWYLPCWWILYRLSHQGNPRILKWVAYPSPSNSWIFPTQESNRGVLHCRWILYQLSYQRSPTMVQSCPTLCNPRDSSPPGTPVPRILQLTHNVTPSPYSKEEMVHLYIPLFKQQHRFQAATAVTCSESALSPVRLSF